MNTDSGHPRRPSRSRRAPFLVILGPPRAPPFGHAEAHRGRRTGIPGSKDHCLWSQDSSEGLRNPNGEFPFSFGFGPASGPGGSLTQKKQPPARVIWGSTRAPTEMEPKLELTAVGCNRRRLGRNRPRNWRAVPNHRKERTSARLATALVCTHARGHIRILSGLVDPQVGRGGGGAFQSLSLCRA